MNKTPKLYNGAEEWIDYGKKLKEKEKPHLTITEKDWRHFGNIASHHTDGVPTGTEDRKWIRAFLSIAEGGEEYVKKVVDRVISANSDKKLFGESILSSQVQQEWAIIGYGLYNFSFYNKDD